MVTVCFDWLHRAQMTTRH